MPRDLRPPHDYVDWANTARDESGQLRVAVYCPGCARHRMELAKSVRKRIVDGTFTGRCRQHRLGAGSHIPGAFDHPAIDWRMTTRNASGLRVQVTCPHCKQARDVDVGAVRRQLRSGRFTGLCRADRLLGKKLPTSADRPFHPFVDWDNWEVVADGGDRRRRTLTRVTCPRCPAVARYNTAYLVRLIRTGRFSAFCVAHRSQADRRTDSPGTTAAAGASRMAAVAAP